MSALAGKVAIVTGGANGLGRATCAALAAEGVELVVADIDADGGATVAAEHGGHFIATDVAKLEDNEAAVAFAVERAGGLDFAFLNAGVVSGCGVGDDFDMALYRRAMSVNIDGVVFGTHAVLPALKARGGGAIVATASLAGLTGIDFDPLYSANKHAVVGLARALGPALIDEGVRFNAICPGFSESSMIEPLRDMLAETGVPVIPATKVAGAVVSLFSNDATGECWFIQAGREPGPFGFRGIPGPR